MSPLLEKMWCLPRAEIDMQDEKLRAARGVLRNIGSHHLWGEPKEEGAGGTLNSACLRRNMQEPRRGSSATEILEDEENVKAQAGWADLSQDLKCLWGLSLATLVFANEEGSLHCHRILRSI